MPEGDTIHKAAAKLTPILVGQRIERAASRWPSAAFGLKGKGIVEIEPVGKNMWIILDDGNALRIHLGMHGKWLIFPEGQSYRGSLGNVSLLLELATVTVVCLSAPTVERLPAKHRPFHPVMAALGPDVLADGFDPAAVSPRIATSPASTLAEVLMDQNIACGIGNVYKSEILFIHRLYPFDPPSTLDAAAWTAVYTTARELMQRNLGPGPRITTPDTVRSHTWVYGRSNRPCLRCGTLVATDHSGQGLPRLTWWCPSCQPTRVAPRAETPKPGGDP